MTGEAGFPRALTVAGSDSGGGAGIQADLKTMQELGVFGMSALTAVTVQNSLGVHGVHPMEPAAVAAQAEAVLSDIGADAVKTGMLFSAEVVEAVCGVFDRYAVRRLTVDPVMIAKGGASLLRAEAVAAMIRRLLPMAEIVTPNVPEACALLGLPEGAIRDESDMADAARQIRLLGPEHVLVKGGHLPGAEARTECADVLVGGGLVRVLRSPFVPTRHTHGTGCTLSAAITAYRARGLAVEEAVRGAKAFVSKAIAQAVPTGGGVGSLWHAAHRSAQAE
ncbi:MAG TPA: bifunctional hydroxymethylpyrimidine kinase/phosphomethylpyrimidine kinase [Paenibacillus sp.]|uniref:bifunctional hydroxymethylpyrimidine kinase/phosphomethylpyrimidine kinase n=1 Tax=Paenibacillus sp. TaxID=58172 RepID=UPI002B62FEB8|nr:bifunctional hydroxymethylpyrimidine kinase/phosphomethylpyrimidine kinase [Paenibacillus sp.]HUC91617.1 bifunctional hydroxymethylpyrimidine kinase/phosphomethylpyrimidine kinase [Paenibacillus sp.]